MRQEVQCAECKHKTPAGPLCTSCGAPLTAPPIAAEPAAPRARWQVLAERVAIISAVASGGLAVRHLAVDQQPYRLGILGVLGLITAGIAVLAALVVLPSEGEEDISRRRMTRLLRGAVLVGFFAGLLELHGGGGGGGG